MTHPMRQALRLFVCSLVSLTAICLNATPVSAHTDFESSIPAAGDIVTSPVDEITLTFSGAADAVDDGFQVLEPSGAVRPPSDVVVEDGRIFRLRFDPPLTGGQIGVRWSVRSGDSHPISGSFTFTIEAEAEALPTTTAATTTTDPPSAPEFESSAASSAGQTADEAPPTADTDEQDVGRSPEQTTTSSDPATGAESDPAAAPTAPATGAPDAAVLAEFLDVTDEPAGAGTARIGRIIGFLGAVIGLGVLAFVTSVMVGRRREIGALLRVAQFLAGAVAIGAAIEYVGVTRLLDENLTSGWSTSAGFATVLRMIGGVAVFGGLWIAAGPRTPGADQPATPASLSAAVLTDVPTEAASRSGATRVRWRPGRRAWPIAIGVVLVLASFWFDGHTVTKGWRPLHALSNTIHVAAGAVWVGGVVSLTVVAWVRHRGGTPQRFGELFVRFSSIATVALLAVAGAGAAMTVMILDSFAELTGTDWGRLLLLKLAAVAIATLFGAYNHFRLRPQLDASPDDPGLLVGVRNVLTAEAILLTFVVVVTVWLVVAAS